MRGFGQVSEACLGLAGPVGPSSLGRCLGSAVWVGWAPAVCSIGLAEALPGVG